MLIVPDMMSWQHFVQLPQIKNLPIHEQTRRYNYYLAEQQMVLNQIMVQHAVGGGGQQQSTEPPVVSNCIEFTADTTIGGTTFAMAITSTGPTTATVDWGDGTVEEIELGEEGEIFEQNVEHEYADEETAYNVTMCFTDPSVITVLNFYGDD
jgi:hypothetical protein